MEKENMKALLRVVTDCKGSDDTLLFKEQMLIQEMSTVEAISSNKRPRSLSLLSGKITPGATTFTAVREAAKGFSGKQSDTFLTGTCMNQYSDGELSNIKVVV
ncbi:hypothetical protein Tco_0875113 [Tanacetum coccineum]|uniref:Uncharacterized protein n=1 Tax=Tanacetum coccineum TaxID=301880 RepID=A0ABQ5BRJ9_9ASTR